MNLLKFLTPLLLALSYSFESHASCEACGALCISERPVNEGCIFVPQRTEAIINTNCSSTTIPIPGANLYYREQGVGKEGGPTLVFVHGTSLSSDIWKCQQEELSRCYRTIAVDLRGQGRSEITDPLTIPYTHQLFANDIHAMLHDPALNVQGKIIFIGQSIGGSIGIVYATSFPDEVCKLVLVGSGPGLYLVPDCSILPTCNSSIPCGTTGACCSGPGGFPSLPPSPTIIDLAPCQPVCWPYPNFTVSQLQSLLNLLQGCVASCMSAGGDYDFCANQCLNLFHSFTIPQTLLNEDCQEELQNAQAQVNQALIKSEISGVATNIFLNAWTQDLRPLLPLINVPTLVTFGTIDKTVPNAAGIYLHDHIPNSKLVRFIGKGHILNETTYKQFNAVLRKFIRNGKFPSESEVPDEGCCVCPLVVPVPLNECSVQQ